MIIIRTYFLIAFIYFLCSYVVLGLLSFIIRKAKGMKFRKAKSCPKDKGTYYDDNDYILGVLVFAFWSCIVFITVFVRYSILTSSSIFSDDGGLLLAIFELLSGAIIQIIYKFSIWVLYKGFKFKLPELDKDETVLTWIIVLLALALGFIKVNMITQSLMCGTLIFGCFFWVGFPGIPLNFKAVCKKLFEWCNKIKELFFNLNSLYLVAIVIMIFAKDILRRCEEDFLYILCCAIGCAVGIACHLKCSMCIIKNDAEED